MPELRDISAVFSIWDSLAEMAREIEVEYQTVAKWSQRGRIPPESWDVVISAAKRKRVAITTAQLHRLNRPRAVAGRQKKLASEARP